MATEWAGRKRPGGGHSGSQRGAVRRRPGSPGSGSRRRDVGCVGFYRTSAPGWNGLSADGDQCPGNVIRMSGMRSQPAAEWQFL